VKLIEFTGMSVNRTQLYLNMYIIILKIDVQLKNLDIVVEILQYLKFLKSENNRGEYYKQYE